VTPILVADRWLLSPALREQVERITREWAAREQLAARNLRPRTRLLLYGPADCGQTRLAEHLAQGAGLPVTTVSLAAWRVTPASRRLRALDRWQDTPFLMFRPDPWWGALEEALAPDPWMGALLDWLAARPPAHWVVARTPDRPHWVGIRRAFDDALGVWPPTPAEMVAFVHARLPQLPPSATLSLSGVLGHASYGDLTAVCALTEKMMLLGPPAPWADAFATASRVVADRQHEG
jgi:hypothetical protein